MTETTTLLPPMTGPMANPLLFGVAAGLSALFPLSEAEWGERETGDDHRTSIAETRRTQALPRDA